MRITKFKRKVRGIYYDPGKGLFMIQTQKSEERWSTPGGEIGSNENQIEGLRRLIVGDTGLVPVEIAEKPFFEDGYFSSGERAQYGIYAYEVRLNVPDGYSHGDLRYEFFKIGDLRFQSLTKTMRNITSSPQFKEMIKRRINGILSE